MDVKELTVAHRTFMGIAIHNLSATEGEHVESMNLTAGVRQNATGLLGTTVQLSDLVGTGV